MQYICRTRAQTTDFSHNAGQKDESGCNSFKYNFRIPETSRGHGDTNNSRHHHKCVTVSPHSDLVLRLKPSCVSSYRPCYETPAPDLSNPAVSEYRMSGPRLSLLTLITRGRPSLSPPSVSSHALPLLLSQAPTGPRITHQTRSPGSKDFTQKRK